MLKCFLFLYYLNMFNYSYKELLLNIDNYPTIRKLRYDLIKMCQEDTLKMNRRDNIKYEINYNNDEVKTLYNCINKWIDKRKNDWYNHYNDENKYYRDLYCLAINGMNKWIYYNVEENTYNNLLEVLNNADYDFYLSVIINNISKYVVNIKINIPEVKNVLNIVQTMDYRQYEDQNYGWGSCNIYDDFYKNYNNLVDAFYDNKYIMVLTSPLKQHFYMIADDNAKNEINERINNNERVNKEQSSLDQRDKLKKYSLLVCENNFENMFVNPNILCSGLEITDLNYYVKFNKYDNKTKIYTVDIYVN